MKHIETQFRYKSINFGLRVSLNQIHSNIWIRDMYFSDNDLGDVDPISKSNCQCRIGNEFPTMWCYSWPVILETYVPSTRRFRMIECRFPFRGLYKLKYIAKHIGTSIRKFHTVSLISIFGTLI